MQIRGAPHFALVFWSAVAFGQTISDHPDFSLPSPSEPWSIDGPALTSPLLPVVPASTPDDRRRLRMPESERDIPRRQTSTSGPSQAGALSLSTIDLALPVVPAYTTASRAALRTAPDRPPVPIAFQRSPLRNVTLANEDLGYTFRTPYGGDFHATLSLGLQTELRYNDNINGAPENRAIADTIFDLTPLIRLNLGERPSRRAEDRLESEYYLEFLYTPISHWLLERASSQWLNRFSGDVGRATERSQITLHLEYEDNIGSGSERSPEEISTILQITPRFEYNLSAKTLLYVSGNYLRNIVESPDSNYSDYSIDFGFSVETSVKTTIGLGAEFGHIDFDAEPFGTQDYQQVYGAWTWRPTSDLTLYSRAGVEVREFDRDTPRNNLITPVALATLRWDPNDRTSVDLSFRVRNEPSIVETGTLFQEVSFGLDVRHDLAYNLYVRGETQIIRREYESGNRELQWTVRPALGYRTASSSIFDSVNFELFYEYRYLYGDSDDFSYERNQVGIQATVYF